MRITIISGGVEIHNISPFVFVQSPLKQQLSESESESERVAVSICAQPMGTLVGGKEGSNI